MPKCRAACPLQMDVRPFLERMAHEMCIRDRCNAGGTFGYKFSPTMEALIGVAVLATGRPCHLRYNYEQQQQYTGKRSPFFTTVRYAADKATGKIKAMEADWIVDHGP